MSGGRFCHVDSSLKHEIFGMARQPWNVFEDREISELIWDVFDLIHDYDWYAPGDTDKDTYLERKNAFKNKWFKMSREVRIQRIIDESINDLRTELYEAFEITPESDQGGSDHGKK